MDLVNHEKPIPITYQGNRWDLENEFEAIAYVDGSYDNITKRYSYGVVMILPDKEILLCECFDNSDLSQMRNIAGEIKGSEVAMQFCLDHEIKTVTIFYDYMGIEKWCTGEWKTKKSGTRAYKEFYDHAKSKVDIKFIKVKGHSRDYYNNLADHLAKKAFYSSMREVNDIKTKE